MSETETAVAVAQDVPANLTPTDRRIADIAWGHDPDRDFQTLAAQANYFSKGFRLVTKDQLIGVPHVVIGVTYRPGYPDANGNGDYVSVEAVVADAATLSSSPIKHMLPGELTVWGNESVVYNDGSTGVRRELTALLQHIGLIDVGPEDGKSNPFDRPFQMWAAGAERATEGIVADLDGTPFRFIAARGLRKSDYDSPYGPATTFYIA